ncbi:MAG: hypothetical protein HC901_03340 [Bdellovibrionaceae bacterium]|nr:hypothetical protein [Pseudobdellovibrionaceae bacterium]
MSGELAVRHLGSGTTILLGNYNHTEGTIINAGTLQLGNGGATGAVAGNITNNGTLIFNRSDNPAFAGVISGTGSVVKQGGGTLTLNGTNTYTGNTTVSAGILSLSGGNAIPDTNTLIISGGKVDLTANETVGILIYNGTLQGNDTYGSTSSTAVVQDDTYFSGTGILTVGDGGGGPADDFATYIDAQAGAGGNGTYEDKDLDGVLNIEEYAFDSNRTSSAGDLNSLAELRNVARGSSATTAPMARSAMTRWSTC